MKTKTWEINKLEEVCEILDNKRVPISSKNRIRGIYPYYGASGIVDYIDKYIFDEELVLIGEDGAKWGAFENSAFIAEGKYWVNNHAHVLKPNNEILINKFLVYFLNYSNLEKYITGATVKKLNQQKLKQIEIPLPPLEEQMRIVKILDLAFEKIDTSVELLKANLANLDELAKSVLDRAFNPLGDSTESTQNPSTHDAQSPYPLPQHWEWKSLGEMCKILNGGTPDTKNPVFWDLNQSHEVQTDKSVVGVGGEVERGEGATSQFKPIHPLAKEKSYYWATLVDTKQKYLYSTQRKITQKGLDSSNATLLPVNSVIFSSRASIGEVCIAKVETATNQGYKNFVCDENVLYYEFLYFALQRFAKEIESLAQGTTYKEVSKAKISEFQIPLPKDIKEQKQIAMHLDSVFDKIQKLKELYNAQLQDYEELKQSLLAQAFSGKL
ncbi:restriction endonuclease subunit S [Campylobacter coli]|nr:restriction endonuclease subunit S [Campylobacter coli]